MSDFCVLLYYLNFVFYCTHVRMSYVLNSYLFTYLLCRRAVISTRRQHWDISCKLSPRRSGGVRFDPLLNMKTAIPVHQFRTLPDPHGPK